MIKILKSIEDNSKLQEKKEKLNKEEILKFDIKLRGVLRP